MKNNPKNVSTPVIVILYLLAAVFLGYGIYMAYDAVVYVNAYDTNNAVSSSNMLQYVVAASASYFGFAIVIFAAASILSALNKVQRNISGLLSFDDYLDEYPEGSMESAPVKDEIMESAPVQETSESAPVEDVMESVPADDVIKSVPADKDATVSVERVEIAAEESMDEAEETEAAPEAEAVTEPDVLADLEADASEEPETEETAEPEVKETVEPVTEESVEPVTEESVEPVTEETAEPETEEPLSAIMRSAAPEVIAQQQPTPEIVIKKQPAANASPQEAVLQYKSEPASMPQHQTISDVTSKSTAANLQPPTVPEEILQSKRKRGLKYETVAMEESLPAAEYTQKLSDTIRLKKEDRDAISSAFIRDIFEKNE